MLMFSGKLERGKKYVDGWTEMRFGLGLKFNPQVLFSDAAPVYPESSPSDEIDDR